MDKQIESVLGNLTFPSVDIDVAKPSAKTDSDSVNYDDVVETDSNQILVEGVTELKEHPQLETFLGSLNDLKNDFILKVDGLSKDFELKGSVKVLFAIGKKNI